MTRTEEIEARLATRYFPAETKEAMIQSLEDTSYLLQENRRMREALKPFAAKEIPTKPQGNAGFYSILFTEIEAARAALQETDNG